MERVLGVLTLPRTGLAVLAALVCAVAASTACGRFGFEDVAAFSTDSAMPAAPSDAAVATPETGGPSTSNADAADEDQETTVEDDAMASADAHEDVLSDAPNERVHIRTLAAAEVIQLNDLVKASGRHAVVYRVDDDTRSIELDDEGKSLTPERRIGDSTYHARVVAVAAATGGYRAFFQNHFLMGAWHIYTTSLQDAVGGLDDPPRRLSEPGGENVGPVATRRADEYGVAWRNNNRIAFFRVDASGAPISRAYITNSTGYNQRPVRLVPAPNGYLLLGNHAGTTEVFVESFDAGGAHRGRGTFLSALADLVDRTTEVMLVRSDQRDIVMQSLDDAGALVGVPSVVATADTQVTDVRAAAHPQGLGIVWTEQDGVAERLRFVVEGGRDDAAVTLATAVRVEEMHISWADGLFLVVWREFAPSAINVAVVRP